MYDFMQRVIVKNLTNDSLSNISISHDGKVNGNYKALIKELKPMESREVQLYTLGAREACNLILSYIYKNVSNTVIVYNKLNGNDLRLIILELRDKNGEIAINTIVDNRLWI
ncbi:hypothetical protein [Clostridium isatidis]|nr:hypothetical protein [Clostridiales bacterium]